MRNAINGITNAAMEWTNAVIEPIQESILNLILTVQNRTMLVYLPLQKKPEPSSSLRLTWRLLMD